ncbi:hypothetical protein ACFQI3_10240 [Hansschlegelia quercus]|uniref:Uncharacterized protein n=1 Tax=Hansschlegelia quercus TaxID=2528245 RepID=A0A4Q9GLZ1_9HYPH|nr:hypothetical protein [Hansschlegelia quercus]TBN54441.1 hypothetical protein EYR15_06315 [Hansschlegelia quercus]
MADAAEELFEDEAVAGDEAAVDDVILAAGGERQAIHALLVQLAETERARALAVGRVSLGYVRGRQPPRQLA